MALLCKCYMCPPTKYEAVGAAQYASDLKAPLIESLKKVVPLLRKIEQVLRHCMKGCQPKEPQVFKAMAVFAIGCGRTMSNVCRDDATAGNT